MNDRNRQRIEKMLEENGVVFVEPFDRQLLSLVKEFGLVEDRANRSGDRMNFVRPPQN